MKVAVSVTTLDPVLARRMEPRAPHPEKRLAAIRATPVRLRIGKERKAGDARCDRVSRAFDKQIDRPSRDARKAGDRLFLSRPVADEQRPDEIAGVKAVLGEHGAHPRRDTAAAHPQGGE